MAKKTLEARLRMIDETNAGARSAAANARAVSAAYGELDKAARKAMLRVIEERENASRTLQRQKISNLEREVLLGKQSASVELERARATAVYRREREALLQIIRSETTTAAQSVRAYRELARTQQLYQQQMRQIGTAPAAGGGTGSAVIGRAGAMLGAYAGVRTFGDIASNAARATEEIVNFERQFKELLAVGTNSQAIDQLRQSVLDTSMATGKSREDISSLYAFIDQGMADAQASVREEVRKTVLMMSRATTADMSSMAEAMIKSWRAYGHELTNVQELADKMFMTVERGFLTHKEFADHSVRVIQAGAAMGFSLDQVLGAYAAATNVAKDAQVASTALANSMLKFKDAVKAGIPLTGDLVNHLEQLQNVDPNLLTDIFEVRNVTVLRGVVDQLDLVKTSTDAIDQASGKLNRTLTNLGNNATQMAASMISAFKEAQKNAIFDLAGDPGAAMFMTDLEATKFGANRGRFALAPEMFKNARALIHQGGPATIEAYIELAAKQLEVGDEVGAKKAYERAQELNKSRFRPAGTWKSIIFGAAAGQGGRDELDEEVDALGKQFEGSRQSRIIKETQDENRKAAEDAQRQTMFGKARDMMGPFAAGFIEGREDRTKELMQAVLDGKPGAMDAIRGIRERGLMSGRKFDEQAAAESSIQAFVAKMIGAAFGRAENKPSMVQLYSTAIFGEGPQTFTDKLMGRQRKQSTLLPLMGEMARSGLAGFLGEENAGFLGLGPAIKKRKDAAKEKEEDDLPVTASLLLATPGYTGAAERAKQAADLKKLGERLEKKMDEQVAAMKEMAGFTKNIRLLKVSGV